MEMKEPILDCAQRLVQQRGFNGFSYADIANEVGIRKASLHHHFPTKTNLGLSLIKIYTEHLEQALLNISAQSIPANKKLEAYIGLYRHSLENNRACLAGMLATEALTLDEAMLPGIQEFFKRNTAWLTEILKEGKQQNIFIVSGSANAHARLFLSALQGALLISRATENVTTFEQTASALITGLMRKG
jgi:TetR/AcrR family transcriptional regulator, transcriptional repressor for nem operon